MNSSEEIFKYINAEIFHYRERSVKLTISAVSLNLLVTSFFLLRQPELSMHVKYVISVVFVFVISQIVTVVLISRSRGSEYKKLRETYIEQVGMGNFVTHFGGKMSFLSSMTFSYILILFFLTSATVLSIINPKLVLL